MSEELINKIENLDISDDFLDNEILLGAVGLTMGPAGLALISAVKKVKQLTELSNSLTECISQICDDPSNTVDKSMFSQVMGEKMSDEQKEMFSKMSAANNGDFSLVEKNDDWA